MKKDILSAIVAQWLTLVTFLSTGVAIAANLVLFRLWNLDYFAAADISDIAHDTVVTVISLAAWIALVAIVMAILSRVTIFSRAGFYAAISAANMVMIGYPQFLASRLGNNIAYSLMFSCLGLEIAMLALSYDDMQYLKQNGNEVSVFPGPSRKRKIFAAFVVALTFLGCLVVNVASRADGIKPAQFLVGTLPGCPSAQLLYKGSRAVVVRCKSGTAQIIYSPGEQRFKVESPGA